MNQSSEVAWKSIGNEDQQVCGVQLAVKQDTTDSNY